MAELKLFYVGVKALIENKHGEILLLKADVSEHRFNAEPYWDIPGGRIEEGQSALEALKREIEEETGVSQISEEAFVTAVISNHEIPLENNKRAGLVLMVYRVKIPENSQIVISPEHTAFEWVDREEAALRLQNKYPVEFTQSLDLNVR
jgi:8-oxo-dGTP diphosphatase